MRSGFVVVIAGAAGLVAGAASAQQQCAAFPVGEASYSCSCPAGFSQGSVWGSGPYTADSSVCTAALHAGVIGADGGKVVALAAGAQQSFTGSEGNGIASSDWGSYPESFAFEMPVSAAAATGEACGPYPEDAEVYSCSCDASASGGGFVWGSGPYSADSDVCTAAVHSGVIGPDGGMVTALRTAGRDTYVASEFNGVATFDWGSYPASFVFDYNQ